MFRRGAVMLAQQECRAQKEEAHVCVPLLFGPSVIIGFQKTQIYQRFAGSRQEVFILHLDYALQVDSRFRPFVFPSIP